MLRKSEIKRVTSETDISLRLVLESAERSAVSSGVPFFDHMLEAMSRHGRFFIDLMCRGDTERDDHHSVEDVGICLGRGLKKALGDKTGIRRFGNAAVPMDDALAMTAVDLSGRGFFRYNGPELRGLIGRYSEELTIEFLRALASNAEMNLHVVVFHGENRHHLHEAVFKSAGVALYKACIIDRGFEQEVPSTKGVIV